MSRTIKTECPQRPPQADPFKDMVRQEVAVHVVTPMFGGGVKPGEPDPVTPIRSTEIRGHLRFWWRATRGAACKTVQELSQRETEIWGNTENPSPVVVQVTASAGPMERRRPEDYGSQRFGPEAYALFSAKQNNVVLVKEGLTFEIFVMWPAHSKLQQIREAENRRRAKNKHELLPERIDDIEADVKTALSAWLTFGGMGARTRRGCGSLNMLSASPAVPSVLRVGGHISHVLIGQAEKDPLRAWASAVGIYQNFRQSFRGPKHKKTLANGKVLPNIPGRSYWPEPDSIRQLTGCALRKPGGPTGVADEINTHDHSRPVVPATSLPSFPRAALGLPIIFHFADGPGHNRPAISNADPADVELVPEVADQEGRLKVGTRMASPVITRPVYHEGQWRPAVVILQDPRSKLDSAFLQGKSAKSGKKGMTEDLGAKVTDAMIKVPANYPSSPTSGSATVLDAFTDYAKGKGFHEVQP